MLVSCFNINLHDLSWYFMARNRILFTMYYYQTHAHMLPVNWMAQTLSFRCLMGFCTRVSGNSVFLPRIKFTNHIGNSNNNNSSAFEYWFLPNSNHTFDRVMLTVELGVIYGPNSWRMLQLWIMNKRGWRLIGN